jgi:PAS domain S-box-containing protein
MKSTELFRNLNRSMVALLALVVILLVLVLLEIVMINSNAHADLHPLQIVVFFAMLGLGLWMLYLKRQLKVYIQSETNLLNAQITSQQAQLKAVNRQVSDIIESTPDLVWEKNLDGVYLSCNLSFERYIGFDHAQIIGKTDFDLATPENAKCYRAHDNKTVAARKALKVEEQHTPVPGEPERLYEIIKTPVFDADGHIVGVQGIGRDITQRRRDEIALYQADTQRRLLELCIARLNDVVVITEAEPFDTPGPRILFVNDAYERMTGYSRAETLGQSPRKLQGPKTQRSELDRIRQAIAKWQPVRAELINYKKNGDEFWVELDMAPLADEKGWFTHWIAVQRDITARKAAEAEMLAICDRALEATRLKSEFLATISHEMRTPMNGVIGMAQLLLDTDLSAQQQLYASHIASAAQDYMQVINHALDFSELDGGQLVLEYQPFALQSMLQAVDGAMQAKAQAKKLTLHCSTDATLPAQLMGDQRRVQQCLMILLDNAIKFTAKGDVALEVKSVQWEGAVPALRISVTDTGIGLSDSDRERLFHPFMQGDGSVTRQHSGIGMGLVVCQKIIELMQGRLGFDSTPGQGSRFWFELPLRTTT